MKMTQIHFRAFANAIVTANATPKERRAAAIIAARVFESCNPKFNRERFYKAAGVFDTLDAYTKRAVRS